MKVQFIYAAKKFKHPELVEAIKNTFAMVQSSNLARYFSGTIKVTIYPGVTPIGASACVETTAMGPTFHFGIGAMHLEWMTQRYLLDEINGGVPVKDEIEATILTTAHEIGHWVLLSALSKRKKYGGHPYAVHLLVMDALYKQNKLENHVNRLDAKGRELTYRKIFPERWADRMARIIKRHMLGGVPVEAC